MVVAKSLVKSITADQMTGYILMRI